jgi:hypothetical protein
MNIGMSRLTCEQAKHIDMVDYLASLGYHPAKFKNEDYWYLSPLRDERTPSFKINRKQNIWYDHGIGQGGNVVDFGVLYHRCSVKELLEKLVGNFSFHQPAKHSIIEETSAIKILSERNIISISLLRYLMQRRIAENVAKKYCYEVRFSLHDRSWIAIGFHNDKGGFELRNQWYKGSVAPKAITTIENGAKELSVFEGFFDFLSYQSINLHQHFTASNFLILNSTSFFEKSRQYMEQYNCVRLFLDRDNTGQKCTSTAISWSNKYKDESLLYKGYKDLNEWTQRIGTAQKRGLHP